MFTDSHCHLGDPKYLPDFEAVMQRAAEARVSCIVAIGAGDGMEGNERACRIASEYSQVYAAIGIHPHDANIAPENYIELLRATLPLSPSPRGRGRGEGVSKIVAIGEIGLDYHYDHSPRKIQQQRFKEQIALADELNLPVIIHSRDAWDDTVQILSEGGGPKRRGVFHCFGGGMPEAQTALQMNFYLSISGILTFGKKVDTLVEVVRNVPLEKMLIETDAPWLAPSPHRGKRNEPAWVVRVAEKIAEIKKMSVEKVGEVTTQNAKRLFNF